MSKIQPPDTYHFNYNFFFRDFALSERFTECLTADEETRRIIIATFALKMYTDVYIHTCGSSNAEGFSMVGDDNSSYKSTMSSLKELFIGVDRGTIRWVLSNMPMLNNNYDNYRNMGLLFNTDVTIDVNIGECVGDIIITVRKNNA